MALDWIKSHKELENHPKTLMFMSLMDWSHNEAIGFLHRFWWWALDIAPDGVVSSACHPGVISGRFGFKVTVGQRVVESLKKSGWLDVREDGEIVIHNHDKRRLSALQQKDNTRDRVQNCRKRKKLQEERHDEEPGNADVTRYSNDVTRYGNAVTLLDKDQDKDKDQLTQEKKETKNPNGGLGEIPTAPPSRDEPPGFSNSSSSGSLVAGFSGPEEIAIGSISVEKVFSIFRDLLALRYEVTGPTDLAAKVRKCNTTPARWVMLLLDKVHYAQTPVDGVPRCEVDGSDPVKLTMAGFKTGQTPSDSANNLFREIVIDHAASSDGRGGKWKSMTPSLIAADLARKKGRKR